MQNKYTVWSRMPWVAILMGVIVMFLVWVEKPTPSNWQGVKEFYNPTLMRGYRVVDKETGEALFTYNPDDGPVFIESIRKQPDGRWEVVFKKK